MSYEVKRKDVTALSSSDTLLEIRGEAKDEALSCIQLVVRGGIHIREHI